MNAFTGRTIAKSSDLSLDEKLYIFSKARELETAIRENDKDKIRSFRIDDPSFGGYGLFLEPSTRTDGSFVNTAEWHNIRYKSFLGDRSSFNKKESFSDTINTLIGYDNDLFVLRTKLEGTCSWLKISGREYAKRTGRDRIPSFINGGDGKHEHPTQELLDEFTFLQDNGWDTSAVHIALIGDLKYGRTVHSKVDGLQTFNEVTVDLVAPDGLRMPDHYVEKMKEKGYEVRMFGSLDEYMAAHDKARLLYFTRPQLERWSEQEKSVQELLRKKITFKKDHLRQVRDDTCIYHPLPRHKETPTIPRFLDDTSLNHWDLQSRNGKLVRTILFSLIYGRIGDDFDGQIGGGLDYSPEFCHSIEHDFYESVPSSQRKKSKLRDGIKPISKGIVIDHIVKGSTEDDIRWRINKIITGLNLYGRGGEWVDSPRESDELRGLIFRPGHEGLSIKEICQLASIAPGATYNLVDDNKIVRKYRLTRLPSMIADIDDTYCKNPDCISAEEHHEGVTSIFFRTNGESLVCHYCDTPQHYTDILGKGF